jgi:hypothetical protein
VAHAVSVQQNHNQNLNLLKKRILNARQLQKRDHDAAAQQVPEVIIVGNMGNNQTSDQGRPLNSAL